MSESFLNARVTLHPGDCLTVLPSFEANSVDSVVTDPPYHLTSIVKRFGAENAAPAKVGKTGAYARASSGFMGKVWDGGDIAFRPDTWERVYRVLKPGAYIVAFSSTRTFGRMSVALDDAGFITHPFVAWIFGQGFPKAHRVDHDDWEGWRYGTQSLKPAIEPIYVGQKPFEAGLTGTANVLKWGTGALNIGGCKVGVDWLEYRDGNLVRWREAEAREDRAMPSEELKTVAGRWPANVIHDGSDEVVGAFPQSDIGGGPQAAQRTPGSTWNIGGERSSVPGGATYGDSGSAASFFYTAKADSDDRLGSKHPTVKPLDLMQYLVRLVTPPKGLVLDPFSGTGTTGEAAWREGMRAVLIEREEEYQADIRRRMALCLAGPDERARESIKAKMKDKPINAGPLFGASIGI